MLGRWSISNSAISSGWRPSKPSTPPPYDLRRKLVDRRAELYAINDRGGNAKSLGPWSHENEARFADYHKRKTTAKVRQDASPVALHETDDFDVA